MDFLINERSFHGQFHAMDEFHDSVEKIMLIRREIKRVGSELFCHRSVIDASITPEIGMRQAVQGMSTDRRRAWMQWLTQTGPYWLDERQHSEDEWLECGQDEIVTDTAIGEAAFCKSHGLERELVSVDPSNWLRPTIAVTRRKSDRVHEVIDVPNHWTVDMVSQRLKNCRKTFDSWRSLEAHVRTACERLTIAEDAFESLSGQPFVPGAAERIQIRLDLLNQLKDCFNEGGERTEEGNQIYVDHFSGGKAWFTDSSDTEIRDFNNELTFPHPDKPGEYLLCTWHGKVKTPQIRIHFSFPISADIPLYVVYVGPKITKR